MSKSKISFFKNFLTSFAINTVRRQARTKRGFASLIRNDFSSPYCSFVNSEDLTEVTENDDVGPLPKGKSIGHMEGGVAKDKKGDLYIYKGSNLESLVINLSYLKVWQEYFASKFIKASALKSFKDQVLVPEVKMMVMPNENRHRASWFIVSKILPLNQFPGNSEKGEHFVSPGKYSEIMAASLKKSNFVPFNYFILPFAIIAPCDHPGPSYTNLGFVKDMLVLCDFGIGFGETPRYPLKQNIFEPENFLADLDCMRGINHDKKLGKMAITALEDFKRGDVMSENYHIGVAVFCQYTSFDTILKSPILSEDQIRSLISVNFGSEKDRQMTNVKDLQKLQGIYIKGATARAAAARELQEVSGILIKDLSPHNIFPSAQRLMEFAEKIGKKKIAEMPDLERRKVIDELVKESGLEEVASEYQDKIKQKPFPKNSSSSKSVSTPLPTIQTSKAKKLQEEDLLKRGDGVFDRS